MKTLNQLNHLLNLNYDVTLNQGLIEKAYAVMQELADDIESTWKVYQDKGYYIDEESFNLLNEVLGALDELSGKLMTTDEVYENYYAEEDDEMNDCLLEEVESDKETEDLLMKFHTALESDDKITMIECIERMKEVDPVYVNLMVNAMFDEEDEDYE